jgi:hypothetical protein
LAEGASLLVLALQPGEKLDKPFWDWLLRHVLVDCLEIPPEMGLELTLPSHIEHILARCLRCRVYFGLTSSGRVVVMALIACPHLDVSIARAHVSPQKTIRRGHRRGLAHAARTLIAPTGKYNDFKLA